MLWCRCASYVCCERPTRRTTVCCLVFSRYSQYSPTSPFRTIKVLIKAQSPAITVPAILAFFRIWPPSVVFWFGRPLFGIIISFIFFLRFNEEKTFRTNDLYLKNDFPTTLKCGGHASLCFVSWFRLRQRLETFLWKTDLSVCVASRNFGCVSVHSKIGNHKRVAFDITHTHTRLFKNPQQSNSSHVGYWLKGASGF